MRGYTSLTQGVKLYLDTVYNIIEDERSVHTLWKKVYLKIIRYVQTNKISIDELESMEADEENYLGCVINILKIKKSLLKLYQHLSEKLDPTGLVISYENVLTKKLDTVAVTNIEEQITDI